MFIGSDPGEHACLHGAGDRRKRGGEGPDFRSPGQSIQMRRMLAQQGAAESDDVDDCGSVGHLGSQNIPMSPRSENKTAQGDEGGLGFVEQGQEESVQQADPREPRHDRGLDAGRAAHDLPRGVEQLPQQEQAEKNSRDGLLRGEKKDGDDREEGGK